MRAWMVGFLTLVTLPSAAMAQARCADYAGTTVAPKSFADVVALLGNTAPKDMFETTAQYRARLKPQAEVGRHIIVLPPSRLASYYYDADTAALRIVASSFGAFSATSTWFERLPVFVSDRMSAMGTIGAVFSEPSQDTGATTSLSDAGVSYPITQARYHSMAIIERRANGNETLFTPVDAYNTIGHISLSPNAARLLQPIIQYAFVVEPQPPYLAHGSRVTQTPTPRAPRHATEDIHIMFGDIQCGLVLDGNNRVLAAYTAR